MRIVLCAGWLLAVAAGGWALTSHQNAPGTTGETPKNWPADSQIAFQRNRPVLLMFAHPQCPCTRASIDELNRLVARSNGKVETHVLFIAPRPMPSDWARSASWKKAAAIPGVTVQLDPDGAEARRFGAESSGFVVLYDEHGRLQFDGGITSARGHAGDNAGENVIVSLLAGQDAGLRQTPVFGCGLMDKSEPISN